jgi:hypothetical protein
MDGDTLPPTFWMKRTGKGERSVSRREELTVTAVMPSLWRYVADSGMSMLRVVPDNEACEP